LVVHFDAALLTTLADSKNSYSVKPLQTLGEERKNEKIFSHNGIGLEILWLSATGIQQRPA
jgi:hypothetical protein